MSKIDALVSKKDQKTQKLDTLADFSENIIARIANNELPWQVGQVVARMPLTLANKPISNINYLSLVGQPGDHRWGRFDEYKAQGASVLKGEKASNGVFWLKSKIKQSETEANDGDQSVPQAEKFVRRPMAVRYFNMAQTDIESALATPIDARESMMQIEDIATNAGITFAKKSTAVGDLSYEGNVVFADTQTMSEEALGEAIFGIVDWSMDDTKPFAVKSTTELRSQFVRAVAGSMLCSEYGVPVPESIQEEMAAYKHPLIEYATASKDEVYRVARDAWEIRQFVHQYAPSNVQSDEIENVTQDEPRSGAQPNNLFGV